MSQILLGPVEDTITAAIYFDSSQRLPIKPSWCDGAVELLDNCGIPNRQFSVNSPHELNLEGMQDYTAKKDLLQVLVSDGTAEEVYIYGADIPQENLVLECDSCFSYNGGWGVVSIGWPQRQGTTEGEILRSLLKVMTDLPKIGYGIAFTRTNQLAPSFYACGTLGAGSRDPRLSYNIKDQIGKFFQHVTRYKRHLVDGFRSIYPAQILNDQHRDVLVEGVRVADLPFGRWEKLPDGLWIWELDFMEVEVVREKMEKAGLLLAA